MWPWEYHRCIQMRTSQPLGVVPEWDPADTRQPRTLSYLGLTRRQVTGSDQKEVFVSTCLPLPPSASVWYRKNVLVCLQVQSVCWGMGSLWPVSQEQANMRTWNHVTFEGKRFPKGCQYSINFLQVPGNLVYSFEYHIGELTVVTLGDITRTLSSL